MYWNYLNSELDSVGESEISSDDTGTDCGNNDSPGSSRSSGNHATEAGWSDLDSSMRIPTCSEQVQDAEE